MTNKYNTVWYPQKGSQFNFLTCPADEVLYCGSRGPGKTDALLMDFLSEVGKGLGSDWNGIIFRKTFPELRDVIKKSQKWFRIVCPEARYNKSEHKWTFPDGEMLTFGYMLREDDYWKYHGHEYPWIGWEELTNWKDDVCYNMMKSCNRTTNPNIKPRIRATTNSGGVGHNWVKNYFIDPKPYNKVIKWEEELYDGSIAVKTRVSIFGHVKENKILLKSNPAYISTLMELTKNNPNLRKSWLEGSWDVTAGGMFDDLWNSDIHIMKPFEIPREWRIDRSFDMGSSKPFSVGYWAESNGEGVYLQNGKYHVFPKGTLFRIAEFYGSDGQPNVGLKWSSRKIAKEILRFERENHILRNHHVNAGPADNAIWNDTGIARGEFLETITIADEMAEEGVYWTKSDKSPGSRITGAQKLRDMMSYALDPIPENPAIYFFENCRDAIRTVPSLPRDSKKMDDIDTDSEDHIYDEIRYRIMNKKNIIYSGKLRGY